MCDPPGVEGVEEAVEKTDPAAETEYKTTNCIHFLQEQTKSARLNVLYHWPNLALTCSKFSLELFSSFFTIN